MKKLRKKKDVIIKLLISPDNLLLVFQEMH